MYKSNLKKHCNAMHSDKVQETLNEQITEVNEINLDDKKDVPLYACLKCAKQYKGIKYLMEHEKTCSGVDKMTCPRCKKTFKYQQSKFRHIKDNKCKPKDFKEERSCQERDIENKSPHNYIYLIHDREFLNNKENIYKIGKTKQSNFKGFNSYSKGSALKLLIDCDNCDTAKKDLMNIFQNKFQQMKDIGNQYFKGNEREMIGTILDYVNRE